MKTATAEQIASSTLSILRDRAAAVAHLTTSASAALDFGVVTPLTWATLDAAHQILCELRLEYGCEDWTTADWSDADVQVVALLADDYYSQETRARQIRDAAEIRAAV